MKHNKYLVLLLSLSFFACEADISYKAERKTPAPADTGEGFEPIDPEKVPPEEEKSLLGNKENQIYIATIPITAFDFVNTGDPILSCSSNPALPTGIRVVAKNETCRIEGAPTKISSKQTYIITGSISDNKKDSTSVTITVVEPTPPELESLGLVNFNAFLSIEALDFPNNGSSAIACSANPTLPAGLMLEVNENTCRISGTPNNPFDAQTHTITAKALGGKTSTAIIEISATNTLPTIEIQIDGYDDPEPTIKIFSPLANQTIEVYDNTDCTGQPLGSAESTLPATSITLSLSGVGDYVFFAKYEGASSCMSGGANYSFHRSFASNPKVTQIFSNDYAFAALYNNGMVVTWGSSSYGGNSSSVATNLGSGVSSIFSTERAFAALKADGSVITWGAITYGGDSSSVAANLSSGVSSVFSSSFAFAALKADGSVITWGYNSYGGDSSSVALNLISEVSSIFSTDGAFAALKADGSVITWGDSSYGADSLGPYQLVP